MSTSLSATQFRKRVCVCLGAALEAWAHMLLYQRRVYPSATFTASTFLGVRSYVSRHPAVVAYISDTLQVAVPSLISGVAQELAFTIVDQNAMADHDGGNEEECSSSSSQDLERYVLRFHDFQPEAYAKNNSTTMETIQQFERGLRDLLLSAHALEHGRPEISRGGDESGVSFRLSLHVPEKDQTCTELNEAFATGAWYAPFAPDGSNVNSMPKGRVIRPLHQFSEASFGSIQFVMLKPKKKATSRQKS